MSNREIVLRLDERWYKALNRHLKNETLEEHMEDVLDEIRTRYDLSILISTHDFNTLHKMDKVILLKQKVLQMGTPEEVLASQEFQTLFYHPTQKGGDAQ